MSEDWFFESLPLRSDPYPGECLSGYLLRLADLNGYAVFWDMVSNLFPIWQRPQMIYLLKWEYPLKDWGSIPQRTGLTPNELTRLTMASWVEKFRIQPDVHCLIGRGHFLKKLVNSVLRVCPLCLQSQPYLHLLWRLLPVSVCLEHGCLLQEICSACGATLMPVSQSHRHLRCPTCGTDFRSLYVTMASQDILDEQRRRQEDFCFLLDPSTAIVKAGSNSGFDASYALGLKFHYLRDQTGISAKAMAQKANLTVVAIRYIERGTPVPLLHYLSYLKTLHLSWKEIAALEVPDKFVQTIQTPRHLELRICPNPKCSNHLLASSASVSILRDIPEKRIAGFHCKICGRRFTRSYDGNLQIKVRHPSLYTGKQHNLMKTQDEIASLIELGLRGENNRAIAHRLGWGEKTIRIYWIVLGLEEQVHCAQAQRRSKEKLERRSARRSQIQVVLDSLLTKNQEITLRKVGSALGVDSDYLHSCPDQTEFVRLMIQQHNVLARQQRDEHISAQIALSIENLQSNDYIVKIEEIAKQAGLSYKQLCDHYPDLRLKVQGAIKKHRTRLKEVQLKNRIEKIDAAATRLIAQGQRLNYRTILDAAQLSPYADKSIPIRDALMRWVSNFAPRD